MGAPPTITIRRQVIDVEVRGSESTGRELQRRLADMCAEVVPPALESAVGDLDPDDASLVVESIAIDLADVPMERLEIELADAVRREVADHLRRHAALPTRAARGTETSGDVRVRPRAETVDEALEAFLMTGRLPWSFALPQDSDLESLVVEAWDSAGAATPAKRDRLMAAFVDPAARARLLRQFSPGFVTTALRRAAPALATTAEEVLQAVEEAGVPLPARAAFARGVWDAALTAAAESRTPSPAELVRAALTPIPPAQVSHEALTAALERRWPGATGVEAQQPGHAAGPVTPRPAPGTSGGAPATAPSPRQPFTTDVPHDGRGSLDRELTGALDTGLLVEDAGVVLLHPFLPRFFDALGVSAGDELADPNRALCLIHLLATGRRVAPEHRLTLAKALCDVPLDQPVEADVGITDAETEEATALLNAAIGHWGALGNTSPDAFRNEFLMRPGQLSEAEFGELLLRVEARTVDVLLDQLPWGLSLVKLPWMPRPMRVEWR